MSGDKRLRNGRREPFAMVSHECLKDDRLSLRAKGLLSLMLTFSDEWDYYISQLSTLSTDGRDSHNAGMRELERVGYVTRQQTRGENGRMGEMIYTVRDTIPTANGKAVSGSAVSGSAGDGETGSGSAVNGGAGTGAPVYGKPATNKNNSNKNNSNKNNTKKKKTEKDGAAAPEPQAASAALPVPGEEPAPAPTPAGPPQVKTEQPEASAPDTGAEGIEDGPGGAAAGKTKKKPLPGWTEMFAALAVACYGGTSGLTNTARSRIATAAKSLIPSGYTAEEVPVLAAWIRARDDWRTDLSPQTLEGEAPKWRHAGSPAPLTAPAAPPAPGQKPAQATPGTAGGQPGTPDAADTPQIAALREQVRTAAEALTNAGKVRTMLSDEQYAEYQQAERDALSALSSALSAKELTE